MKENIFLFRVIIELERILLKNELGETVEKVVKHEIRFVDSFKFMASSLEKLVGNLEKEQLIEMRKFFCRKSGFAFEKRSLFL